MRTLLCCLTFSALALIFFACSASKDNSSGDNNSSPTPTGRVTQLPTATTGTPGAKVGHLQDVAPITNVSHGQSAQPTEAGANDPLYEGDVLATGDQGAANFTTTDVERCITKSSTEIRIRPNTSTALEWMTGKASCVVKPGEASRDFSANGVATLAITGTVFQVSIEREVTQIGVFEGEVVVTSGGNTTTIGPRQQLTLPGESLQPWRPSAEDLADLDELIGIARELSPKVTIDVMDMQVGECFPLEGDLSQVVVVKIAPCEDNNFMELTGWIPLDESDYPGTDTLDEAANKCKGSHLLPTEERWDEAGFRQIGCFTYRVPGPG